MQTFQSNVHVIINNKRTDFKTTKDFERFLDKHQDINDLTVLGITDIKFRKTREGKKDEEYIYSIEEIVDKTCNFIIEIAENSGVKSLNLTSDWKTEPNLVLNTSAFIEELSDYIENNIQHVFNEVGNIPLRKFKSFPESYKFKIEQIKLRGLIKSINKCLNLEHVFLKGIDFNQETYNDIYNYIRNGHKTQIHTDFSEQLIQKFKSAKTQTSHPDIIIEDALKFGTRMKLTVKGEEQLEKHFDKQNLIINKLSGRGYGNDTWDFTSENGFSGHITVIDKKVTQIWINLGSRDFYSIDNADGLFWYDKKICGRGRMAKILPGKIDVLESVTLEIL